MTRPHCARCGAGSEGWCVCWGVWVSKDFKGVGALKDFNEGNVMRRFAVSLKK